MYTGYWTLNKYYYYYYYYNSFSVGTFSNIDHFILTDSIFQCISSYYSCDEIDNQSDHLLLLLYLLYLFIVQYPMSSVAAFPHKKVSGNGVPTKEFLRDIFVLLLIN